MQVRPVLYCTVLYCTVLYCVVSSLTLPYFTSPYPAIPYFTITALPYLAPAYVALIYPVLSRITYFVFFHLFTPSLPVLLHISLHPFTFCLSFAKPSHFYFYSTLFFTTHHSTLFLHHSLRLHTYLGSFRSYHMSPTGDL